MPCPVQLWTANQLLLGELVNGGDAAAGQRSRTVPPRWKGTRGATRDVARARRRVKTLESSATFRLEPDP